MKNNLEHYKIYNPATGEETGSYDIMDTDTVNEAVKKARTAFRYWSKSDFSVRKKIMKKE